MQDQSTNIECIDRVRISERVMIFRTHRSPCWYVQYNQDGRQFKPSLKTRSQKQAQLLARKVDAQLTLGATPERRKRVIRIEEASEQYIRSQKEHVGAKTLAQYRRDLLQFARFSDEVKVWRLADADAEHLETYAERLRTSGSPKLQRYLKKDGAAKSMREGPIRPKTVRAKLKTIRQMIKWAAKRRLVDHDPCAAYRLPPEPKIRPQPFTPAELKTILKASDSPFRSLFNFFRLTGLRNDELCWLLKTDVDSQFRFIYVRAKICPFTGRAWQPKHGNDRIVPLCAEAREIAQAAMRSSTGPWLFGARETRGSRPGQFRKARIWRALKAVLKANSIDHGTVHTFRHCYCSFLANHNVSPFIVMKYMGHSSLDIVMTYYHAATDDLLSGMASLDFGLMLKPDTRGPQSSQLPAK